MSAAPPPDWSLAAYVAHNEARWAGDQRALELQAHEYERRLESLNHENARIAAASAQSVPREIFESRMRDLDDFVAQMRGRDTGAKDNRANVAWAVAVIASLLAIGAIVFRETPAAQVPAPQIIYVPAQPGTLIPSPSVPSSPK